MRFRRAGAMFLVLAGWLACRPAAEPTPAVVAQPPVPPIAPAPTDWRSAYAANVARGTTPALVPAIVPVGHHVVAWSTGGQLVLFRPPSDAHEEAVVATATWPPLVVARLPGRPLALDDERVVLLRDGRAVVVVIASGKEIWRHPDATPIHGAALRGNVLALATGSYDEAHSELWNLDDSRLSGRVAGARAPLRFAPDGRLAAACRTAHDLAQSDHASGFMIITAGSRTSSCHSPALPDDHIGWVNGFAFSSDGGVFVARGDVRGHGDREGDIHALVDGHLTSLGRYDEEVHAVAIDPEGRARPLLAHATAAVVSADGRRGFATFASRLAYFDGTEVAMGPAEIAVSSGRDALWINDGSKLARLDLASPRWQRFAPCPERIADFRISPDGELALLRCQAGRPRLWSVAERRDVRVLDAEASAEFVGSRHLLKVIQGDSVVLQRGDETTPLRDLPPSLPSLGPPNWHLDRAEAVAIVGAAEPPALQLQSHGATRSVPMAEPITSLGFRPRTSQLWFGSEAGIYRCDDGCASPRRVGDGPVAALRFSPDGAWLWIHDGDHGRIHRVEGAGLGALIGAPIDAYEPPRFSGDGAWLLFDGAPSRPHAIHAATGTELAFAVFGDAVFVVAGGDHRPLTEAAWRAVRCHVGGQPQPLALCREGTPARDVWAPTMK